MSRDLFGPPASLALALLLACTQNGDGEGDYSSGGVGSDPSSSEGASSRDGSTSTTTNESESETTQSDTVDSGDGDSGDGDMGDGDTGDGDSGDGDTGDGDTGDGDTSTSATTGDGDCVMCEFTLPTFQSGALEMNASSFWMGDLTLDNNIVYALGQSGAGRVVFSGDSNSLYLPETTCPFWEWLGSSGTQLPRLLTFGAEECNDIYHNVPAFSDHAYYQTHLPAQYADDPAALAADWDAVIFCENPYFEGEDLTVDEVQTLIDFTKVHGGGTVLVSEWFTYLNQNDLDSLNLVANALGGNFLPVNLDWGGAEGTIDFNCFPIPE